MNRKGMLIPVIIGSFGTGAINLKEILNELEIRGRIKTIPTIALIKSAEKFI